MNPPSNNELVLAEQAVKTLEQRFNTSQNIKNNWSFFVNLSDYVEFVNNNPLLRRVVSEIEDKRTRDYSVIYEMQEKAEKEVMEAKEKIEKVISANKIQIDAVAEEMKRANELISGVINSSAPLILNIESCLFEVSRALKQSGYERFIQDFIDTTNKMGNIYGSFNFSKHLEPYKEALEKINQLKKVEMWDCWYTLKYVPQVKGLTFAEAIRDESIKEDEASYYVNSLHLKEELSGNTVGLPLADRDLAKTKDSQTRLHLFLIEKLSEIIANNQNGAPPTNNPTNNITSTKLCFYTIDGIAEYKSITATFSFGTKARALLDYLFIGKNTPLNINDIRNNCNQKINLDSHHFKKEKDVSDTIKYIKDKLKVKKGEYFPIYKKGKTFFWIEK
jgi:hypothetical protein